MAENEWAALLSLSLRSLKTEQVSVRIRHPLTRSHRENSQQAGGTRLGCERQRASGTSVQPQNHAMGAARREPRGVEITERAGKPLPVLYTPSLRGARQISVT